MIISRSMKATATHSMSVTLSKLKISGGGVISFRFCSLKISFTLKARRISNVKEIRETHYIIKLI